MAAASLRFWCVYEDDLDNLLVESIREKKLKVVDLY